MREDICIKYIIVYNILNMVCKEFLFGPEANDLPGRDIVLAALPKIRPRHKLSSDVFRLPGWKNRRFVIRCYPDSYGSYDPFTGEDTPPSKYGADELFDIAYKGQLHMGILALCGEGSFTIPSQRSFVVQSPDSEAARLITVVPHMRQPSPLSDEDPRGLGIIHGLRAYLDRSQDAEEYLSDLYFPRQYSSLPEVTLPAIHDVDYRLYPPEAKVFTGRRISLDEWEYQIRRKMPEG